MITEYGHILTRSDDYDILATAEWFWERAVEYLRRRLEFQVRFSAPAAR